MDNICLVVLTVGAFVLAEGAVIGSGTQHVVCKNNTQCGVGECCYIEPEFLVMSKRRRNVLQPVDLLQPVLHTKHDTGYCEKYHAVQGRCFPLEQANGHCGCPRGTGCRWVSTGPVPTAHILPMPAGTPIRRRSMIYHPGPGEYRCVNLH